MFYYELITEFVILTSKRRILSGFTKVFQKSLNGLH